VANFITLFGISYTAIGKFDLSFDSGHAARGINYAEKSFILRLLVQTVRNTFFVIGKHFQPSPLFADKAGCAQDQQLKLPDFVGRFLV
jgi:hypothetical protein